MKVIQIIHLPFVWFCFFFARVVCAQEKDSMIEIELKSTCSENLVLFAPLQTTTTYLIDTCGTFIHQWNSKYKPGQSVYLLPDGSIIRPGNLNDGKHFSGGVGGIIEKISWDGKLLWSYHLSDSLQLQHHDVCPMPNGNILCIVYEKRSREEALEAGRNPVLLGKSLYSEKVIELKPIGRDSAEIVWQWRLWDHLIQDCDSSKMNYGDVKAHPERLDINYNATLIEDWIHLNSIDYNGELNQILLSSHKLNEFWIIDRGANEKANLSQGDFVYRWGNPAAYRQGNKSEQKCFAQHHVQWIEKGLPNEGKIVYFNNGNGRPGGNYSTIECISVNTKETKTLINSLPEIKSEVIFDTKDSTFFAANASGVQVLKDGGLLLCHSPSGTFLQVDKNGKLSWRYSNPFGSLGESVVKLANPVFRVQLYPKGYLIRP